MASKLDPGTIDLFLDQILVLRMSIRACKDGTNSININISFEFLTNRSFPV